MCNKNLLIPCPAWEILHYTILCRNGGNGDFYDMNAEIISVGTELLLGQILNTDARFISEQLASTGINLFYTTVVGDNAKRLKEAAKQAFARAELVIFTGGLGPTGDDLTKETVSEYFGLKTVCDEYSLNKIKAFFEKINVPMTENNVKQAYMPEGAEVIENFNGTAPGCIIEKDGKTAVLIPGPPSEAEPMFKNQIMPYLLKKSGTTIVSKTVKTFGIGESALEDKVKDLMQSGNPTLAPYAKTGEAELRITAKSETAEEAERLISDMLKKVEMRIGGYIYGYDDETLNSAVYKYLKNNGLTLATAESCTGGLLADSIVKIPGSSGVFGYGVVTYANEAKMKLLGVKAETLEKHGAVSPQTAAEMAEGVRKLSGSRIGASTTGIAGPDGGTEEKPVGLVYIAVAYENGTYVKKLNLSGNREKVRTLAVKNVLHMIMKK